MNRPPDDFTRNLIAWQNQVVADRQLTLLAFHVAYVIGQHVNRGTGDAWPSQPRICQILAASESGVKQAIKQLEAHGHLHKTVQRGRTNSNRYRPIHKPTVDQGPFGLSAQADGLVPGDTVPSEDRSHPSENRRGEDCFVERNRHEDDGFKDANRREGTGYPSENRRGDAPQTVAGTTPNYLNEPSEGYTISSSNSDFEVEPPVEADPAGQRPTAPAAKSSRAQATPQFDEWWRVYPRKVGKEAARPVFERILKAGKASLAELAAGAERYAAERAGEDPTFTKHPKTWLNGGHWNDEPAPRATAQRRAGQGYSALNRLMEDGGYGE